jgi:PAS domain S-box-containing protein
MEKNLKILLVEFNNEDLKAVEKEIKKSNIHFSTRRVVTRESYLRELKVFKPDIIIADLYLPQFNAEEALNILNKKNISLPFIIISRVLNEELAISLIQNGADNFILKKNFDRLPTEINNAIKKHKIQRQKTNAIKALKANEDLFRIISENLNDLITVLDKDGKVLYASPSFKQSIGYNPNKLKGRRYLSLIYPDDKGIFLRLFNHSKNNKEIQKIEFRCKNNNNEWKIFEAIINWINDRKGKPFKAVLVARDITERKLTEIELKSAKENAVKLIRVKDDFLTALSKDVREPLNVMMGYTSILIENNGKTPLQKKAQYLEYIENAGKNLVKSIDKILLVT